MVDLTDDRAKAETRVTCTGCGAELDRYATECSKCECSGCDKPIAHCECSDQPEPLDIRQAEERAQLVQDDSDLAFEVLKIHLAQDYLALLKFTREELVPALSHALEWLESEGCDCGTDEPGTCGLCEAQRALSRARETGLVEGSDD